MLGLGLVLLCLSLLCVCFVDTLFTLVADCLGWFGLYFVGLLSWWFGFSGLLFTLRVWCCYVVCIGV